MSVYPWDEARVREAINRSPVKHPIVVIRGVDIGDEPRFGRRDRIIRGVTSPFYDRIARLKGNVDLFVITASLRNDASPTIEEVVNFITLSFHPASKVIIYGFSAGGYNALHVCRKLDQFRYHYGERRPVPGQAPPTPDRPKVVVDLLVTVDPVNIQLTEEVRRTPEWSLRVPPCVRWGVNYYQTSDDREGRGWPIEQSQVRNINCGSGIKHRDMNDYTEDWVVNAMNYVLHANEPTAPHPHDPPPPAQSAAAR